MSLSNPNNYRHKNRIPHEQEECPECIKSKQIALSTMSAETLREAEMLAPPQAKPDFDPNYVKKVTTTPTERTEEEQRRDEEERRILAEWRRKKLDEMEENKRMKEEEEKEKKKKRNRPRKATRHRTTAARESSDGQNQENEELIARLIKKQTESKPTQAPKAVVPKPVVVDDNDIRQSDSGTIASFGGGSRTRLGSVLNPLLGPDLDCDD